MKFGSITTGIVSDGLVFNMDAANRASCIPNTNTIQSFNTISPSDGYGDFINDTLYEAPPTASRFTFDGVADYIDFPGIDDTILRDQQLSILVWLKANDTDTNWVIGNPNSSNKGTGIFLYATDKLHFQIGDNTNDSWYESLVTSYSDYAPVGTWNHVAGTFNGSEANIYVNGILRNTWNSSTGATGTPPTYPMSQPYTIVSWTNFWIGRRNANTSDCLDGSIGNTQIYNRGLSELEVLHNYNALKGRFT